MRIVLTNAGQQEIKNDIYENTNENTNTNINKKYKSEPKNYIKKDIYPYKKKINHNYTINHNISHILTEQNYLNDIIRNKNDFKKNNNSFIKIDNKIQLNNTLDNNINNFKLIKVANKIMIPKEIKEKYIKQNEEIKNEKENIKININKNKQQIENNSINNISLPLINNSFPLKDLLQKKNIKNINHNLLYKEINENEKNLISYLKSNRTIKPSFMEIINKANDKKLNKLDKICQKYFNNEKQNELLQQNIKDKIKLEYSNDSKFCRKNLLSMGKNIQNSKKICISLLNQKDDYIEKKSLALYLLKKK